MATSVIMDPTFGFNCTAAFFPDLLRLRSRLRRPLASLCARHTKVSLALGRHLFDFCNAQEGHCSIGPQKTGGGATHLQHLRDDLVGLTRRVTRWLAPEASPSFRKALAQSGKRTRSTSRCDDLMYVQLAEQKYQDYTHVPVGNLIACMNSFKDASFSTFTGLLHHAMWQLDALQDLRPMWIFDPKMMGGVNGEAEIEDGKVVKHSFRSFLLTRLLKHISSERTTGPSDQPLLRAAEIGVAHATTSRALVEELPSLHLILVEPYVRSEARSRMEKFEDRVTWIEDFSHFAHAEVADASLDLVFIDGLHSYDAVVEDLRLWSSKVRFGGCLSGHDFGFGSLGVVRAVSEFAQERNATIRVQADCFWFFRAADGTWM